MLNWAVLVCPLLLPLSYLWDVFSYWRLVISYWLARISSSPHKRHRAKVQAVQEQVLAWQEKGKGKWMCTARPSWMSISQQRIGYKEHMYRVELGSLRDILAIDTMAMEVTVEPAVSIGFLNRLLVSHGVTLGVVPELDSLTVGGLLVGGGIESTSHRHGLFHRLASQVELVTADGSWVTVSEQQDREVFRALPMSYGTLGFVVSVTLRLEKYLPYIRLSYTPTHSRQETCSLMEREARGPSDSVEGIVFNRDSAVVMTGTFVGEEEVDWARTNRLGLWYKPWFHHHVETFLAGPGTVTEYIPTLHFHQRHNRPTFWLTDMWLPWSSGPLARLLSGWLLPMNHQLLSLVKETFLSGELADNFLLQDFILPIKQLEAGLELTHTATSIYPLWLVPVTLEGEVDAARGDTMFVDLGVYGLSMLDDYAGREKTLRRFERFTLAVGGFQALYAETLMTREEFLQMFPEGNNYYYKARAQLPLCNEAFPEVYEKVSRAGRQSRKGQKAE